MKKILLVCAAWLAVVPSQATAGLDLSWSACNRGAPPGTGDLAFDCSSPGTHAVLFANFQVPTGMSGFFALDAVIDLQTSGAALPPFWHFETGGCNATGLNVSDARPDAQCPSADNANPWGAGGVASDAFITAYGAGLGGANRARLLVTVARAASSPFALSALQNYYGFHLDLAPDASGTCAGCGTPTGIGWTSATFYSANPTEPNIVVSGPGMRSNSVTLNGGKAATIITSISPSQGFADGTVSTTIYGRGFVAGATAALATSGETNIPGTAVTVAPDGQSMTATFDLYARRGGLWNVVVTNPGQPPVTLTQAFQIQAGLRIYSINPDRATDAGNVPVTITGSGFQQGATPRLQGSGVTIDGQAVVVAPDGRSLTADFPLFRKPSGLYDVVVSNPDLGTATLFQAFRVIGGLSLSSIAPVQAPDSSSAAPVTAMGRGFLPGTVAALTRPSETITGHTISVSGDGGSMVATFDLRGHSAGQWTFTVTRPDTISVSLANAFTVLPALRLTSIAPARGSNGGPLSVALSGQNFAPGLTLRLEHAGSPSIVGNSVVVAPDGASATAVLVLTNQALGFWDVIVTSNGQTAALLQGFEIRAGFRIYSVTPTFGADSGSVTASIVGSSIDPAVVAKLTRTGQADILGTGTSGAPDSTHATTTFDLRGHLAGTWDVTLRNPDGTTTSLVSGFTIYPTPHLISILPNSGYDNAVPSVTITGTGLGGSVTRLKRAGQTDIVGSGTAISPDGTQITTTFDLRNRAAGLWNVVVSNDAGLTSTLPGAFEIRGTPRITSVTPNAAADSGAATVSILGSHFDPAATAKLSRTGETDIPGQATSVTPDGTLLTTTFNLGGRRFGVWDLVVRNPDGQVAVLTSGFVIITTPHVTSIVPDHEYDNAVVTLTILGNGFGSVGTTARLTRAGQPDILGNSPVTASGGTQLTAQFDLRDRAVGLWNVVVTNPGGSGGGLSGTLANGFEIRGFPRITTITPSYGDNAAALSVRIDGRSYQSGATARLTRTGSPDIVGQSVVVAPGGASLTASFNLAGAALGSWDVRVTNPDLAQAVATGGFQVTGVGLSYIAPTHGGNGGPVSVLISGIGISPAATVQLVPPTGPPIIGSPVSISTDGRLIATLFDLRGHDPAICDVTVRNPSGSSYTLAGAFTIEAGGTSSASGLDLTWSACNQPGTPGTDDVTLDCGTGAPASLYANFQVPQTLSGFITLDAALDVRTAGSSIPEFWHFEDGGCNATGLSVSDSKPESPCPSASNATPWGAGGLAADAYITAYAPGLGGANHARLLLTVTRDATAPTTLDGGQNYFGFRLDVGGSPGGCSGCTTPAEIAWSSATLYANTPGQPSVTITGPGRRSNIVTVNGGPAGVGVLSIAPRRAYADGFVTASIYGRNFESGATARLVHSTETITGQGAIVSADGRSLATVFNLLGKPIGMYDVVVTNPSTASGSLLDGFEALSRTPVVRVVSPNGGESYLIGSPVSLQWTANDEAGVPTVDLLISRSGPTGSFETIAAGVPNTGSITWISTCCESPYCLLRVVAHDAAGFVGEDVSDNAFTLFQDYPNATELAMFEAAWVEGRAEIRWRFIDPADGTGASLERSASAAGPWSPVSATVRNEDGVTIATDAGAAPDASHDYRIVVTRPSGETLHFGPVALAADPGATIRLSGITSVSPNPMSNTLQIGFAVAKRGAVRLSVLDVQGREVAVLIRGEQQAGRYQGVWDGRTTRGKAPVGIYFVRFAHGGKVSMRRIALAR
jgi:hypothetical protein